MSKIVRKDFSWFAHNH